MMDEEVKKVKDAIDEQKAIIEKQKSLLGLLKPLAEKIAGYWLRKEYKSILKIILGIALIALGGYGVSLI